MQVALLYYALNLLLGFVSRKVFIEHLGTDVLGLNTTASNLLELLNLAELGVGMAVGVTLYKPLFDRDEETINEIVTLQGWLYRRIAWVVAGAAVVLMGFFPLIFAKMTLPMWYAYGSFGVLLVSALLTYFVNYRQVVLAADQKGYKITLSYKTAMLVKRVAQIGAVIGFENGYVWWLAIELLFAFIASFALNVVIRREYPYLREVENPRALYAKYTDVVVKIKQIFVHKIGGIVLTQTSPLIIYAYASLSLVALYGNYMLIVSSVMALCGALFSSLDAGVGNLVAQGDRRHTLRVFEELFGIRFFIAVTVCFAVYRLTPQFIDLWIGAQYRLDNTTLGLMVAVLYINLMRTIIDSFKNAFGLFRDVWAPIAEAALNLGLSILFGYYWGVHGILTGVLVSLLVIVFLWKPYFVFRDGFREPIGPYVRMYAIHAAGAVMAYLLVAGISALFPASWGQADPWHFVLNGTVQVGMYALLLFGVLYVCTQGMRDFVARLRVQLFH